MEKKIRILLGLLSIAAILDLFLRSDGNILMAMAISPIIIGSAIAGGASIGSSLLNRRGGRTTTATQVPLETEEQTQARKLLLNLARTGQLDDVQLGGPLRNIIVGAPLEGFTPGEPLPGFDAGRRLPEFGAPLPGFIAGNQLPGITAGQRLDEFGRPLEGFDAGAELPGLTAGERLDEFGRPIQGFDPGAELPGFEAGEIIDIPGNFDLTPTEERGISAIDRLLEPIRPTILDPARSAVEDIVSNVEQVEFDPFDSFAPFKDRVNREISESERALKRSAGFAGNLFSTDTIRRLGDIRSRGTEALTSELSRLEEQKANLQDRALGRRLQALPLALQLATLENQLDTSRLIPGIQAALQFGGLQRELGERERQGQLAERRRARGELQSDLLRRRGEEFDEASRITGERQLEALRSRDELIDDLLRRRGEEFGEAGRIRGEEQTEALRSRDELIDDLLRRRGERFEEGRRITGERQAEALRSRGEQLSDLLRRRGELIGEGQRVRGEELSDADRRRGEDLLRIEALRTVLGSSTPFGVPSVTVREPSPFQGVLDLVAQLGGNVVGNELDFLNAQRMLELENQNRFARRPTAGVDFIR